MALLCVAFLVGMFVASPDHFHPAVEHQHGAHRQHSHVPLLHAHVIDHEVPASDPHVDTGDHRHDDSPAMSQPCCLARARVMSAALGMVTAARLATLEPALRSILDLTLVSHMRGTRYLIGPGLRGPPV